MAGGCLRRFVRLVWYSDGAGLAGFVASAVTERSEGCSAIKKFTDSDGWKSNPSVTRKNEY
jgi:hypothetical protein